MGQMNEKRRSDFLLDQLCYDTLHELVIVTILLLRHFRLENTVLLRKGLGALHIQVIEDAVLVFLIFAQFQVQLHV